jgi:hypothetical protein
VFRFKVGKEMHAYYVLLLVLNSRGIGRESYALP